MSARRRELAVGLVVALVVIAAYVLTLVSYHSEAQNRGSALVLETGGAGADRIGVDAQLLSIDAQKNEAVFRLAFTPEGKLATPSGAVAEDVVFTVDSATGSSERPFAKGKLMSPADVTVGLTGEITDFPFDTHRGGLLLFFSTPAPAGQEGAPVATSMDVVGSLHGYKIATTADDHMFMANLDVSRASSTVVFAIFVMSIMWLLALGAFAVAWRVVVRGAKPELAMFSFMAAMIFAFPAVRNALPGAPPIGALTDFIAFFWTEALVAISLVMVVGTWLFRRT